MSISMEKILATGAAFAAVCTELATNAELALRLGVKIGRLGDAAGRPDLLASAVQPIIADAIKAVDQREHLMEQGVNPDLLFHLVTEAMTTDGTVTPTPTVLRSTTTVHNDDWTDEEDAVVRDLLVNGERLRTIAVNVGRSPGAVRARLRRLYGTSDVAILRRRVRR